MLMSITSLIFHAIRHKKIVSKCCGKEYSASVDIESTSPSLNSGNSNDSENSNDSGNSKNSNDSKKAQIAIKIPSEPIE